MPAAIPAPVRQRIWRCVQALQPVAAIAETLGLSERTVRHHVRRLQLDGSAALKDRYARCGRAALPQPQPLIQEALTIRDDHPTWGAGLVRVFLRRRHPQEVLPSERTLQRWFQRTRSPRSSARAATDGGCRTSGLPTRCLADRCRGSSSPASGGRRLLVAPGR